MEYLHNTAAFKISGAGWQVYYLPLLVWDEHLTNKVDHDKLQRGGCPTQL